MLTCLNERLREVRDDLSATCLVENREGWVVAHAIASPPHSVADAVLAGSVAGLRATRRTVGVFPGGPVQHVTGEDWSALVLPLYASGEVHGHWWVVGTDLPTPDDARVAETHSALSRLLAAVAVGGRHEVAEWLCGKGELPQYMRDLPLTVAVVLSEHCGLASALRRSRPTLDAQVRLVDSADGVDVLIAGGQYVEVLAALERWITAAGQALGTVLTAGLSDVVHHPQALPKARERAAAAARATRRPGRCTSLAEARSEIVLAHVASSLGMLPDLGDDPLQRLLAYDASHGTIVASTLLAWLEAHGNMGDAAAELHAHPNTVRYRVNRAVEVLGVDVRDPAVRLELHLRLRYG